MQINIHTSEKLRADYHKGSESCWVNLKCDSNSLYGGGEVTIYCKTEQVAKAICDAINLRDQVVESTIERLHEEAAQEVHMNHDDEERNDAGAAKADAWP